MLLRSLVRSLVMVLFRSLVRSLVLALSLALPFVLSLALPFVLLFAISLAISLAISFQRSLWSPDQRGSGVRSLRRQTPLPLPGPSTKTPPGHLMHWVAPSGEYVSLTHSWHSAVDQDGVPCNPPHRACARPRLCRGGPGRLHGLVLPALLVVPRL